MSKEKKVNREEAFQMLRDGMKQVDIANYFECNKSYITQLKKEMLKNEETNNGNGKPKEVSFIPPSKPKEIIQPAETIGFMYNSEEAIEESLNELDYDIMKKICYRMLNQLRSKCTGNPKSATDEIVNDADYLLDKMKRMGLIR